MSVLDPFELDYKIEIGNRLKEIKKKQAKRSELKHGLGFSARFDMLSKKINRIDAKLQLKVSTVLKMNLAIEGGPVMMIMADFNLVV